MGNYYVGLDVHKASICIAVLNAEAKLVMESVVETSAATILDFLKGLRGGHVEVTFEEGTHAAWLYDVLKRTKTRVVVCDPRKNRLLSDANKSEKVDARKLAQLLRAGLPSAVYHGQDGTRDLKELVRSYQYLVEDSTRVMNWIQGAVSESGDCLRRDRCLQTQAARGVACEVGGSRSAGASRTLVFRTGSSECSEA